MKASNNNMINGGGCSNTLSILDRNPKFITPPLKPILPADVSSSFSSSSYQFDVGRIIIKREEEEVENIRRPNKSPPPPPPAVDDTELSIFEARNYFNDPIVQNNTSCHKQQQQQEQSINVPPPPAHHHHRSSSNLQLGDGFRLRSGSLLTPTASSEASWNSQTGLLTNPVAAGALSISESSIISSSTSSRAQLESGRKKNGGGPAGTRWFLFGGKTCPCSGKKSVQVKVIKPATTSRVKDQLVDHVAPAPPPPRTATIIRMPRQESEEEDSSVVGNSNNYKCRISLGGGGGGGFTFPDLLNNNNAPTNSSSTTSSPIMMKKAAAIHHQLDPRDHVMKKAEPVGPNFGMHRDQDPPRDSLEVFQPSGGGGGSSSLIRKSMVINASRPRPRDDGRLVLAALAATSPTRRVEDDDKGSDASSDLFEIESFSTNEHSSMASSYPIMTTGRQRDSLDEARPRFSTTTAANNNNYNNYYEEEEEEEYEPSEASVAWTVTTAGYDQASMAGCSVSASDVEEFTRLQLRLHHHLLSSSDQKNNNEQGGKRRQSRSDPSSNVVTSGSGTGGGGGILMSCRCEKAVSVGPDPVKFHHPLVSSRSGDQGGGHVNGRPDGGGGGGRSSHAARLSLAFST